MKELFDKVSIRCSRITTKAYSTSFSIGIRCMDRSLRDPIYSIYGFVRFADEIVDTFHDFDKELLFKKFKEDTWHSIEYGISLNPILNSFQQTVATYRIERVLIERFLQSMEMDLSRRRFDSEAFKEYILGSAEVVGLMCLSIFCRNDHNLYERLKPFAMRLGSAFQKVNFLRDLRDDFVGLERTYFPGLDPNAFDDAAKRKIEDTILADFEEAYKGIVQLPRSSRFGVYLAYVYYLTLFKKIRNTPSRQILNSRIRIHNRDKAKLLAYSFIRHQLNLL